MLAALRVEFMRIVKNGGLPDEEEWLEGLSAYFCRAMERDRLAAWLCFDGAEAVASAALRIDPVRRGRGPDGAVDGYIMSIYTKPAYRRRGLAGGLLELAIADARKRGLRRLVLHPTEDGRPLYEAFGFRPYRTVMIRKLGR